MLKQITQEETNRRYIRERTSDRETHCLRFARTSTVCSSYRPAEKSLCARFGIV